MRFTQTILAALSIAASEAVILTNSEFTGITAGTPFQITYAEALGAVTVYQASGTPQNVIRGAAIGSSTGATGSIPWTPASGGSFALVIVDAGAPDSPFNPNYSPFFEVAGPVVDTTTTTGAAASTSTTTTGAAQTTTYVLTTTSAPSNTTMTTLTTTRGGNSTVTSSSTTKGASSSTSSSDSTTSVPTQIPDSMASGFASPLAFVFLAVGALLTLN